MRDNVNLKFIHDLFEQIGMIDIISDPNLPFTLFLPDNGTFMYETKALEEIIETKGSDVIESILKNHIFNGIIVPDLLSSLDVATISSITSASFTILNKDFHGVTRKIIQWYSNGNVIKEAKINTPQGIKTRNAIIYVIDTILY